MTLGKNGIRESMSKSQVWRLGERHNFFDLTWERNRIGFYMNYWIKNSMLINKIRIAEKYSNRQMVSAKLISNMPDEFETFELHRFFYAKLIPVTPSNLSRRKSLNTVLWVLPMIGHLQIQNHNSERIDTTQIVSTWLNLFFAGQESGI